METTNHNPTSGFQTLATSDLAPISSAADYADAGVLRRIVYDGVFPLVIEDDSDSSCTFAMLA
jgi:hypothetical protein